MPYPPGILARGPWPVERVACEWRDDAFEPAPEQATAADRAIAALADRGSPSHDGLAARLADYAVADRGLELELQPMRWALRLNEDAAGALSVLCLVRDRDGRWLAGRRAPWVATWPGRWALGAGGAVDVAEDPAAALARELAEEWSVAPDRLDVEALVALPGDMVFLVGQAWLDGEARVQPDAEHDAHAWWPRDPAGWPPEADPQLARMARLLG